MTAMLLDELRDVLRRALAQPNLVIARDTTANDIPGWDSLSHLFVVLEIESRFGVAASAEEVARLPDIGALCDLIERRRARPG